MVAARKSKRSHSKKVRPAVDYERQAFNKLKPEFDQMVGKVAARMREAAASGRPLTVDGAALHVVAEQPARSTDDAKHYTAEIKIEQAPVVGIAPPTITFVEYGDVIFMFTNGGQKFPLELSSYASIARAVEQIEATGAIKITIQNLRHLNARSSAH